MITPILTGADRISGVGLVSPAPQTFVFSRREIVGMLQSLDGCASDEYRVDLGIIVEGDVPVMCVKAFGEIGEPWHLLAGHTETKPEPAKCSEAEAVAPNITPNISEPPKSPPDRFDTGFPEKTIDTPEEKPESKAWTGGDTRPLKMEEEPKPPAPKAEAKPESDICADCGAVVSKTQVQMSNLFLNRTLCKVCMDKITGKGVSKC